MILPEPYNSWLIKNVGENLDAGTRFVIKVNAVTASGPVELSVDLDLTWFVMIHSKDEENTVLDVALELLKDPAYLQQFKATLLIPGAKRLIAEFLLFKPLLLAGLRQYIDFTLLNAPIDFISHALFIKHGNDPDTPEISMERINIANMVLDTGFSLTSDVPPNSVGVALHKILTMEVGDEKFTLAHRMLGVGYKLFSDNSVNNNEVVTTLVEHRANHDCVEMLRSNADVIKTLKFKVAENQGNLADYYYWVKEDMGAVQFIRATINLDITP